MTFHGRRLADVSAMRRDDWLELRRGGLGASDAGAVLGVDPYTSPTALWAEKTGRTAPWAGSEAADWGLKLEALVRDEYSERTDSYVFKPDHMFVHPEHGFMRASPDGFVDGPETGWDLEHRATAETASGVYEGKTATVYVAGDWEDGQIPARYLAQAHHLLAVTGLDWCDFGVLIGGNRFLEPIPRVHSDPEMVDLLVDAETEFWALVESDTAPPVDGSRSTRDTLAAIYDAQPDQVAHLDADHARLVIDRRAELDADIRRLTADKEAMDNQLRAMLGDAVVGLVDGHEAVTWRPVHTNRLDTKALRGAHPEIAAEFTKTTTTRRLVVKGVPDGDH